MKIQTNRLGELETTIAAGVATFVEVGKALTEIRDSKLYRESHKTFDDYCESRWGWTRQYANQICRSADVVKQIEKSETKVSLSRRSESLETIVSKLPANEGQARPLARLPAQQQAHAWREAVATAPNGKPTAAHVQKVVAKRIEATEADDEIDIDDIPSAMPEASKPKDKIGNVISKPSVLSHFNRAQEVKDMMRRLSDIKSTVIRALEKKDGLFYPINPSQFQADCGNLYRELKQCLPHAVCPYCAGDGCKVCKNQGWVNELTFDRYVPEDLKK